MTTPQLPKDRPIPDHDDLRLLAELINNAYIPLANAAYNARMTQTEAALRLVSMAERGMPLRLVADGDRQALWQVAQSGPVGNAAPAPADPTPPPGSPQSPERPESPEAAAETAARPDEAAASGWAEQSATGPAGEHVAVTILEVLDPADAIVGQSGHSIPPGQRAVLVHTAVANRGGAPYAAPGDLNLVLESAENMLLGRAGIALPSHPVFPPGIDPGRTVEGWSAFLIPADTRLAGIKWCIRPDAPETILSWPIAP